MKKTIFLILAVLSTACARPSLDVRTDYFTKKQLASTQLDTPDPRKTSNDFGQRILISWHVPAATMKEGPCSLTLHVRYKNGEEYKEAWPITSSMGKKIFHIYGDDYSKKGGLLCYSATINSNGKAITKSNHKLWVEKVHQP
jgi:hypothetical protein